MAQFVFAIICLALSTVGVIIRKTFYCLPVRELKRRARHESQSRALYRAVAYGDTLRVLLWAWIAVWSAAGFVLLAQILPLWLGLPVVATGLWLIFSWLPASRASDFDIRLTQAMTPAVTWLLNYAYPLMNRSVDLLRKMYRNRQEHTGLFERSDLLAVIEKQQLQADSRLSSEELETVKRAVSFDTRRVSDVMTVIKQLKTVRANDTMGPILIDELHRSGQAFALVRDTDKGAICGTLAFKALDLKAAGRVRDVMNPVLYYLHEADSLRSALQAFFTTNQSLFMVVNNAEDCVGVISLQDILRELLGSTSGDAFDQYTDLRAVAGRRGRRAADQTGETQPEEV